MNKFLITFLQINEKTKKVFLVLVALFILLLLIFGFIYSAIARHVKKNAKHIDTYMVDLCRYRIVTNPEQFVKAVTYYEKRNLHRAIKWSVRILFVISLALMFYCIFSKTGTTKKVFGSFFDLFPHFKWQTVKSINKELKDAGKPLIVGISWLPVSLIPQVSWSKINPKDINLYISSLFYITFIVLMFKISGAALSYTARIKRGKEKAKTVFERDLDEYNFHDSPQDPYQIPINTQAPGPINNQVPTNNQTPIGSNAVIQESNLNQSPNHNQSNENNAS